MEFGAELRRRRNRKNISAREMAKRVGCSVDMLMKYERDYRTIPLKKIKKFCKEYGVDIQLPLALMFVGITEKALKGEE